MRQSLYTVFFGMIMVAMAVTQPGCVSSHPPLPTPEKVDLDRFMGPWFVVGYTPLIVDKGAHNAVEHYYRAGDGRIKTTYQFRKGAFDGKLKTYTPTGFVRDTASNAEWGMQFIWPFKADYCIVHLSEDYSQTIIAHPNRKYAWIMQRSPDITEADYTKLLGKLEALGFDTAAIRRLPQDWSKDRDRLETIREIGASRPLAD